MKFNISILFICLICPFVNSQNLDEKLASLSTLKLNQKTVFKPLVHHTKISSTALMFSEMRPINTEALNYRLFSNFTIVENTYKDYNDFFNLCGPLEDGVTHTESGSDRILSTVLNNFVNNVLFNGRGPITRLFNLRQD